MSVVEHGISRNIIDTITMLDEGWTITALKNDTTEFKALYFVLLTVIPLSNSKSDQLCEVIYRDGKADIYTGNKEHCDKIGKALKFINVDFEIKK